jgi:hypothetical protein
MNMALSRQLSAFSFVYAAFTDTLRAESRQLKATSN